MGGFFGFTELQVADSDYITHTYFASYGKKPESMSDAYCVFYRKETQLLADRYKAVQAEARTRELQIKELVKAVKFYKSQVADSNKLDAPQAEENSHDLERLRQELTERNQRIKVTEPLLNCMFE